MLFPFIHPIKHNLNDDHSLVPTHERPPQNTSDGGEFLDDGFRMEDLPIARTEEVIAAGYPENLL